MAAALSKEERELEQELDSLMGLAVKTAAGRRAFEKKEAEISRRLDDIHKLQAHIGKRAASRRARRRGARA